MPPIKDFLTDNTIRAYYALDESMMRAHREDRDEHAISTARILLENPDLPLLIRARACMVIGCSTESDFLDMAKESVRIAKLGFERCSAPGETEHQLVAACNQVLEEAQAAFDEMDDEAEGEVVWEATEEDDKEANKAEEGAALSKEVQAEEAGAGPSENKEKKSRRLHTDPQKMILTTPDPPALERKQKRVQDFEAGENDEGRAGEEASREGSHKDDGGDAMEM
ncbi:hypothetical protein PRZ48_014224 [Zasmidium cellare]|uniref:Uncharacterized protein n=1 Tax=Zasmidium cellare TaxID=395010 RepID=A0ABR0E0B7_ZASCE|nr:hypothetical protein PRZ48_014224 [Zasmidium cellare]